MSLLLPALAFVFASLLVAGVAMLLAPSGAATIERRLGEVTGTEMRRPDGAGYDKAVIDSLKRLGNLIPRSPKEMGKLQLRIVQAGYRGMEALPVFLGIRVGFDRRNVDDPRGTDGRRHR